MKKNDLIQLEITDITELSSGVGRYEGMAVFVPQTAVGDRITARIVKVKKNYAYGIVEEILTPSKDRIIADCPTFKKCGGCTLRHISYDAECSIKENKVLEVMKRIGKTEIRPNPIIRCEDIYGYRNKAQYPINQKGEVGFYSLHSHRIVPCYDCKLTPAEFSLVTEKFSHWVKENNVSIYSEECHKGLLRHFYLRKAVSTKEYMAVIVINGDGIPEKDELVISLKEILGDGLKCVILNINKKDTNVILGDENKVIYGKGYITDILCGVKVRISPNSFYQVNHKMAHRLYEKVSEYARCEGKRVLDLYCGAGTIGLSLKDKAKEIVGVEIVPQAVEDAKFNAVQNGIENARFICADAKTAATELAKEKFKPDVVIVDPPRKGCDIKLLKTISEDFCPERLVYVSCDVATLARDVSVLRELGYDLVEYTPVDMFPRTMHVETVALIVKNTCFCK